MPDVAWEPGRAHPARGDALTRSGDSGSLVLMVRNPNLLCSKRLSPLTPLAHFLLVGLVSTIASAQDRQVPVMLPRPRVPIYEAGQPVQRKVLKNGVRLLVQEQRTSDRVAGVVGLRMGTLYETEDESGLSQIVMRALPTGTLHRDPIELQLELIAAQATLEASAGPDMGQVSISTLRESSAKAVDLLADVVLHPSFPDTAFESARAYYLGKASDELDSPLSATYALLLRALYRGSPFERPAFGRVRSIAECRRSDIRTLYRKQFVGGNITVCFVGNFDGKKLMAQLEKAFSAAPGGVPPARAGGDAVALSADTLVSEERPYQAQSLAYGYSAPGYDHADYPAFMVIDSYLRSGDRSPITFWLPERRIATGIGVLYPRYPRRSSIAVYLGATPANWKTARDTVVAVFKQLATWEMDEGDWPVHIRRVQDAYFHDQSKPLIRARDLSRYETQDLGLDYPQRFESRLLALKPADVRAAAERWFTHACAATLMPLPSGSRP